jgi:hypothetical protein
MGELIWILRTLFVPITIRITDQDKKRAQNWISSRKIGMISPIPTRIETQSVSRNMRYSQALAQMISGSYIYKSHS